jgi:5-hydroxyisourate hydrolase-like protein (transthyretin family)
MKKVILSGAACLLVGGLIAAPGVAKSPNAQGPKGATVSVAVTPNPATVNSALTASGNVFDQQSCRKARNVTLSLFKADGTAAGTPVTVVTGPNGDYTAPLAAQATAGTYTLKTSVEGATRVKKAKKHGNHGKGKKKGQRIYCAAITGADVSITVN